jgi:HK97 family phage major capsid protein
MITRDSGTDALVPEPFSAEVIKELPSSSAALTLCRRARMSTKTSRQPVLSLLPQAYWVAGDTGLKQTTKTDWENLELVAEEMAVIVPVPEAYIADSGVPIWDEVRPVVVEAFGAKLDQAILFGTSKPSTWTSAALVPGAIAAGNAVENGDNEDIGQDIAAMGELLAEQGYTLNSFASKPGFNWRLVGHRTKTGDPIYGARDISQGTPSSIFGRPNAEIENGSWASDQALLLGGDFTKAIVGIRQDITFKVFTEGVITDDQGVVLLNLMQQDAVAMRFVMRVGYALANPVSPLAAIADRFPFAVLQPDTTP